MLAVAHGIAIYQEVNEHSGEWGEEEEGEEVDKHSGGKKRVRR